MTSAPILAPRLPAREGRARVRPHGASRILGGPVRAVALGRPCASRVAYLSCLLDRLPPAARSFAAGCLAAGTFAAPTFAAALLACLASCGDAPEEDDAALVELERFAFVPAASVRLAPGVVVQNARPLLVERFETTREQAAAFLATLPEDAVRSRLSGEGDGARSLPQCGLDLAEARQLCASRGLRLLTASEWLRCAVGRGGSAWPFGARWESVANTAELRLSRATPVGSFGQGASPEGVHDLVGNAAEWVDGTLDGGESLAWAMGGSWASLQRPMVRLGDGGALEVARVELDPRTRDETVGLRACADAEELFVRLAPRLPRGGWAAPRLRALGRSFGPEAKDVLVRARERVDNAALRLLAEGAGS